MLRAGVDRNAIRAWLCHAGLEATPVDADLEAKAISLDDGDEPAPACPIRDDKELMDFLQTPRATTKRAVGSQLGPCIPRRNSACSP